MSVVGSLLGPSPSGGSGTSQPPPESDPETSSTSSSTTTSTSTSTSSSGSNTTNSSTSSSQTRSGTPVDAPAIRADFSAEASVDVRPTEAQARSFAVEAQTNERVSDLVESLAKPVAAPTLAIEAPEKPEADKETPKTAFNDNLKTLRGQGETSGTLMDRAA